MNKFILALAVAVARAAGSDVVTLTDDSIDDFLAQNKAALVEFYAPWCGHCKKLEPEYEKAATQLKGKAVLAKVDATVEKKSAEKYGIQGFPTLKWFEGGENSEYDGGRTADTIVEWVNSMSGPAVSEVTEVPEATGSTPNVVLYAETLETAFEDVAKGQRRAAKWMFVKQSGAAKVTLQHAGEDAAELADITADAIKGFVKDNKMPLFGVLDGDTFSNYMESGLGLVWSLFEMKEGELDTVAAVNREMMQKVARQFKGKFAVTYTDTVQFAGAIESMLGVTKFPAIAVQKKAGDKKKFTYDGEMDADKIIAYIEDVIAGKIVAKLKSEKAPEEPQQEPVKVVVGDNLQELVFTQDKDVLLEVYAPWCGHCKKLEPEYIKVGKKVQKEGLEDLVTIAKMDGTQNDSPVESIDWSGFPTIFYVKAGETEPEKFNGDRTAKGIWQWIKKNHSKKDVLKERIAANKAKKADAKEEL